MNLLLAHPNIETKLQLTDSCPTLLVVENPHQYYNFVTDLLQEFDGGTSDFSCWDGLSRVRGDKVGVVLLDHFSFELADKRMVALLHKRLARNFLCGSHLVELNNINSQINGFLQDLATTVDFSLDFNELTLDDLLKSCGVKPSLVYQSLLEKIICYVNMFVELKGVYVFVFVGLKDVLTDDELMMLYKHCQLAKVCLLLVESCHKRPLLDCERAIVITDDLCEITQNFPQGNA